MSKEELFKKYQEIVLKTNGGADDAGNYIGENPHYDPSYSG